MEIRLQSDKCVGHAQCYAVNPEFFPVDDGGYSTLEDQVVRPEDEVTARLGVQACPEAALLLVLDPKG